MLDPAQMKLVENAKRDLARAWRYDQQYPRSFPINVDNVLSDLRARLRSPRLEQSGISLPAPRPTPKHLLDLVDEKIVKEVFEQQNSGSYLAALATASEGGTSGAAAFRKIVNTMYFAYGISLYGADLAPKPRVELLHRALLDIAGRLDDFTIEGARNFLEYMCPCPKKHSLEAVKKLKERTLSASSSPKER